LQRDQPIPVWGWAAPGEEITVSMADQKTSATAGNDGKWMVKLNATSAGGPFEMVVQGKQTVSINDVLVGEVWLCSGQSNMEMSVARSQDFEKEKTLANLPNIRMITVAKNARPETQADCSGEWTLASSDSVGKFSATAWFFGRKLHEELDVPIGLIASSWGGTDVAAWTSRSAQENNEVLNGMMESFDEKAQSYDAEKAKQRHAAALADWELKTEKRKASGKKPTRKPRLQTDPMLNQNRPSNLFNGMINPLVPYGIRGVIWYQGERNAKTIESGKLYAEQLTILITDWRTRWGIGDFPFITVQLPNFHKPTDEAVQNTGWVLLRESQLKTLALKNTGIAVTTDLGMANDIHPKNKQGVGQRLALWALGTTYEKEIVYSGPIFSSFQYDFATENRNGRGQVYMDHAGDELKTNDGSKAITGFAIAGADRVFYPATGYYNTNNCKLFISSDEVENPIAVRYNWADNPNGNLVNSANLPAAPFRTDDWEIESDK
jgi:sialate O-acetylesterase